MTLARATLACEELSRLLREHILIERDREGRMMAGIEDHGQRLGISALGIGDDDTHRGWE